MNCEIINSTTNRTNCFSGLTTNLSKFYSEKAFVGNFRFPIRRCFGSAENLSARAFLVGDKMARTIQETATHYPKYIHRYYVAICEIDFCKNKIESLFVAENGDGIPLCSEHQQQFEKLATYAERESQTAFVDLAGCNIGTLNIIEYLGKGLWKCKYWYGKQKFVNIFDL